MFGVSKLRSLLPSRSYCHRLAERDQYLQQKKSIAVLAFCRQHWTGLEHWCFPLRGRALPEVVSIFNWSLAQHAKFFDTSSPNGSLISNQSDRWAIFAELSSHASRPFWATGLVLSKTKRWLTWFHEILMTALSKRERSVSPWLPARVTSIPNSKTQPKITEMCLASRMLLRADPNCRNRVSCRGQNPVMDDS